MQVSQQSVPDPVMRHRLECVTHLREELRRAGALVAYAGELDRVDRGEPADRPAEVDIRPQHGSSGAGEVDTGHAVTHGDCQAARQCCQQDLFGRGLQYAARIVDLRGLFRCQGGGHSDQIVRSWRARIPCFGQPHRSGRLVVDPVASLVEHAGVRGERRAALRPVPPARRRRLQCNVTAGHPLPERGEQVGHQHLSGYRVVDDAVHGEHQETRTCTGTHDIGGRQWRAAKVLLYGRGDDGVQGFSLLRCTGYGFCGHGHLGQTGELRRIGDLLLPHPCSVDYPHPQRIVMIDDRRQDGCGVLRTHPGVQAQHQRHPPTPGLR